MTQIVNGDINVTTAETSVGLQGFVRTLEAGYLPLSAPSQTIKIADCARFTYYSNFSNSGAGHYVAAIAWYRQSGLGDPNYAIAHESKWEGANAGATVSLASCYDGQIGGSGNVTVWNGTQGRVTNHSGHITYARGLFAEANTSGTITNWYGFYNATKVGAGTVTNNFAVFNEDPNARIYSAGPICDGTLQYATPTTGQTVTIADNVTTLLVNAAGTLASLIVNLPANPGDGQRSEISTVLAITSLTLSGNGHTLLQAVGSLAAGGVVAYKFYAGAGLWYRVG